ncbi:MAG TPA: hypothetical protein VFA27_07945 [Vicinamibacterales bacterium]|nr:hypothetical protein [Vicinamibacterales bacterium]
MKYVLAVLGCAFALCSCGGANDVASMLTVDLLSTGWRDAAPASGRNKIVPSASVRVTNASDRTLPAVQVNAVFHRRGEDGAWGSAFVAATGSSGLTAHAGATLTLNSERGYTSDAAQEQMLTHQQFVDATVDVFAKYGSHQWTRVGAYPIARQLLK